MQVINESLDDLKKLETAIEDATREELDYSDKLFLLASSAQSKAIAGLALAIKESGSQDTFGLTPHAAELGTQEALIQDVRDYLSKVDLPELEQEGFIRFLRERQVR